MHMAAARLGSKTDVVGTRWANSCPGCTNRLRKPYSPFGGGSFLVEKAAWPLSGKLSNENASYCMLIKNLTRLEAFTCTIRNDAIMCSCHAGWPGDEDCYHMQEN